MEMVKRVAETKTERLSMLDSKARNIEENYNGWLSFKKRLKKSVALSLTRSKEKSAKNFPAFSGALGIFVTAFTTLGIIVGASRGFNFTVGGEGILALAIAVGAYFFLKKFSDD